MAKNKNRKFIGPLPKKNKTAAQVARQRRRNEKRRAKAKAFIGPRTEKQSMRRGRKARLGGTGDYKVFGIPIKSKYSSLKEALGARFSKASDALFGEGNYKSNASYTSGNTVSNSIIHSGHNGAPPIFGHRVQSKGSFPIKYRDFVAQITSSNGAVNIQTFIAQAANSALFTFMSRMANMFEEWDPHGLVFFFESTASFAPGTIGLGDVVMYFQYRPDEAALTTVVQALTYDDSVAGNPTQNMLFGVECKKKERPYPILYVSDGTTQGNQDIFDFGKFSILTNVPGATTNAIGRLWVTYDIDFYKPVPVSIYPNISAASQAFHLQLSNSVTSAAPFGGTQVVKLSTLPGVSFPGNNSITLANSGLYCVIMAWQTLTGTVANPSLNIGSNISIFTGLLGDTSNVDSGIGSTNAVIISLLYVNTPGTGVANGVTAVLPTSVATGGGDVLVFSLPSGFTVKKPLTLQQLTELYSKLEAKFLNQLEDCALPLIEEIKEEKKELKSDDSDNDAVYLSADEAIINGKVIQLNPEKGFQSPKKRRGRK